MTFEDRLMRFVRLKGPLIGRILVGGLFLMAGISKIFSFEETTAYINDAGLPSASLLALVAIIIEICGGLSVIFGYKIKYGAMSLVVFTFFAAILFNSDFSDHINIIMFQKDFAIIGGLLYIMAHGAGSYSIDHK